MSGEPPTDLSPVDAKKVLELLTKLSDIMRPLDFSRESAFFNTYRAERIKESTEKTVKTYSKQVNYPSTIY